jgi:ubiquinone/menaquinone biosynthesis C-methylase UbiE
MNSNQNQLEDSAYDKFVKLKKVYEKIFNSWVEIFKKELFDCSTVLDLGCGRNSPIQYVKQPIFSVGVEIFEPYLQESKKKRIHDEYIRADIRKLEFKPKTFDAVLCLKVIEHLTKEEGYELIRKMERWARKKIIITTPNGFLWQNGYDDNPLQMHKSGWSAEELRELGFKVYGINGWKKLRGYRGSIKYKPKIFWTIISDLTQKIVYRYPRFAFQLFAVKNMK